jgi:adenylate cyclase
MGQDTHSPAQAETRKLAAIMFTDMVGFSRQMGSDEARTLRLLAVHNHIIEQAVGAHHGQVIKTMGDGFLVEFPSVVHAVQCAQQIQSRFHAHNAEQDKAEQIHIRIGIHLGDMVVQLNGDVLGDGVNIASRLQTRAEPDTICISDVVYRDVAQKIPLGTVVSLGRPKLKNIVQRFPVYALLPGNPKELHQTLRTQRLEFFRRVGTAHLPRAMLVVVGLLIAGGIVTLLFPSFLPIRIPQSSIRNQTALPFPDKPSIVVLPFTNMSGDPEQEYFSDGITEDITADLSKISGFFVIARNSAFTYKGKAVKIQEVSREMGVRYVLEGSVRKAGEQVRVTAQLIDGTTGGHLWSERYDRPLKDIFAVQDEIRQKIVLALRVMLTQDEQERLRRFPTNNLDAYDYLLRGQESAWRFTPATNAQARQMFEKAVALDPSYAAAYASLAATYWRDWWQGEPNPQALDRAYELAQKAVNLDDSLPIAHIILAQVYVWKRQYVQAIAEGRRAVALDPNYDLGYQTLGDILSHAGQPQEALEMREKSMRLNPRYPSIYLNNIGYTYFLLGRYEEATAALKKCLSLTPNLGIAHVNLAVVYAEAGRKEEARAEAAEILRLYPTFSLEVALQRFPFKEPAQSERYLAALRKAGLK